MLFIPVFALVAGICVINTTRKYYLVLIKAALLRQKILDSYLRWH
jgi:hypothetical protein